MKRALAWILILFSLFSAFAEPEWVFPEYAGNDIRYLGISEDGKSVLACKRSDGGPNFFGYSGDIKAELFIINPSSGKKRPLILRTNAETEETLERISSDYYKNRVNDYNEFPERRKILFEASGYTSWLEAILSEGGDGRALENIGDLCLFWWNGNYQVLVNLKTAEAMMPDGEVTLTQDGRFLVFVDDPKDKYLKLYEDFDTFTRIPLDLPDGEYLSYRAFRLMENGDIAFVAHTSEINRAERKFGYNSKLYIISQEGNVKETVNLGFSQTSLDMLFAFTDGTLAAFNRGASLSSPSVWYSPKIPYLFTPVVSHSGTDGKYTKNIDIVPYSDAFENKVTFFTAPLNGTGDKMYALSENELTEDFDLVYINTRDFTFEVALEGIAFRAMAKEIEPDSINSHSLLGDNIIPNGNYVGTYIYGPVRLEKPNVFESLFGNLFG